MSLRRSYLKGRKVSAHRMDLGTTALDIVDKLIYWSSYSTQVLLIRLIDR